MNALQAGTLPAAQPAGNLQGHDARPRRHTLIASRSSIAGQRLYSRAGRCPTPSYKRSGVVVRAAAASAGGEDPYKVLGLTRGANSDAVSRAYKKRIADARGNDAEKAMIENAHSSIMMSQLSARMKGGVEVAKDIRFADKAVYFPWRPRRHNAERKVILWSGVAYAVMAAWSLFTQTTAGTQPLIAATVIGGASNVWKLQQIFPPGPSESGNASGIKNLLRGALLAVAATFLGCFLFFTLPDWTAAQLNKQLPYYFYENEQTVLTIGTAVANWVMSSFFR